MNTKLAVLKENFNPSDCMLFENVATLSTSNDLLIMVIKNNEYYVNLLWYEDKIYSVPSNYKVDL